MKIFHLFQSLPFSFSLYSVEGMFWNWNFTIKRFPQFGLGLLVRTSTNMLSTSRLICLCRSNQTARNFPASQVPLPSLPALATCLSLNSQLLNFNSAHLTCASPPRVPFAGLVYLAHLENLCTGTGFTLEQVGRSHIRRFCSFVFPLGLQRPPLGTVLYLFQRG